MHLVMLETNGNQRYVFASPRLRDAIGASYLLTQLDAWTKKAYGELESTQSRPYEEACVSRSSGKVILCVSDDVVARQLISAVTRRVAAQAPGMDVTGVYIDLSKRDQERTLGEVDGKDLEAIHKVAARYAMARPPAQARFPQIPFLVRGRDSALPASPRLATFVDRPSNKDQDAQSASQASADPKDLKGKLPDEANDDRATALALANRVKRYYALHGREGFLESMTEGGNKSCLGIENLRRDITKLEQELEEIERAFQGQEPLRPQKDGEERLSRVAVIHIDGNDIGALMQNLEGALREFHKKCADPELLEEHGIEEDNSDAFPNFVKAINAALEKAITDACRQAYWLVARLQYPEAVHEGLEDSQIVHVVPVLLGGDDATVIANGDYALPFTVEFLRAFEQATAADPLLSVVAEKGKFTAGAGIAIVRTAFPFHLAYDLAERLASQAKSIGKEKGASTFSYHELVDTTILDSTALIERYSQLACQAFIVSDSSDGSDAAASSNEGDAQEERSENWAEMVRKTALFTGRIPAEGQSEAIAFPGTRAQRMRRLQALIAAGKDKVEYGLPPIATGPDKREGKKPSELLKIEWQAVQRGKESYKELLDNAPQEDATPKRITPLMAMSTEIGSHEFFFDLINLKELLPEDYLRAELGLTSDENDAAGK